MALTNNGTDISKSGFAAISKQTPKGPLARKQLVRNPDGSVTLRYVDNDTGQTLSSLQGYNLVEANNYLQLDDLGLDPIKDDPKEQTTAEKVVKPDNQRFGGDSDNSSAPSGGRSRNGGPTDNFGYINKPGFMGFAGAIPGPIGLAGKAVNLGINAMNTGAVNQARSMMGLPKQSFMESVKSTVRDQHGQIGDVKIETPQGTAQYPVGFEALDKNGRTNMTPQEAALRARANETPISLASKNETKTAVKDFKQANPEADKGLFSSFTDRVTGFLDNLFGRDSDYGSGFPDAPAAPENHNASMTGNHAIERERDFSMSSGGGLSSQAERAASSGGGGLY